MPTKMLTKLVAIAELVPPPRNVRVHPEQQIVEFMRAVQKFGQTRPVVIDEDNMILAGNGLVEACRRLGHSEIITYRIAGLSAGDKTKLILSDNRIYSLGLDDHGAILEAIRGLDEDFDIPGFDAEILKNLTLDTSSVTDMALDNYGKLSDGAVKNARARSIKPGSTDAAAPAGETAAGDVITCPRCGHKLSPS